MEDTSEKHLVKKRLRHREAHEVENIMEGNDDGGVTKLNFFASSPITKPMLFPENWEQILGQLSLPDFISAINSCPQWSQLMHGKKTTMFFPLVVPFLIDYLPVNDALCLRRLNKSLKTTIDSIFHKVGAVPENEFEFGLVSQRTKNFANAGDSNLESFTEVRNLLSKTDGWLTPFGNPFLSGCVTLKIDAQYHPANPEHHTLSSLLDRFGHQIYTLILELPDVDDGLTVPTLVSVMNMNFPNLREIVVRGKIAESSIEQVFLSPHELPELPNLRSINVVPPHHGFPYHRSLYFIFLPRYGSQLSCFYGDEEFFDNPKINLDFLNMFCQLRNVAAHVGKKGLARLTKVSWKLERLHLNTALFYQQSSFENKYIKILRAVNNFASTLTVLQLDFKGYEKEAREPRKSVFERRALKPMPNLRVLKTAVPSKCARLEEFLEVSCPNLEEVHFVVPRNVSGLQEKYLANMGFEKATKLKKVTFWVRDTKKATFKRGDDELQCV